MAANVLKQAWLVLVLAVCFGAALAGVHVGLSPRIEANRRAAIYDAIPVLVEGAVGEKAEQIELGGRRVYRAYDAEQRHLGWVIQASGDGFVDEVELLIGLDLEAERITGIHVLQQSETPGLGAGITEQDWREQFAGAEAERPVRLVSERPDEPNEVEAITGATVSSESVRDIVNAAVADVREAIHAGESAAQGGNGDGQ